MILTLLALHLVGLAAAGMAGLRSIRAALLVAAIPPAITTAWAISALGDTESPATGELIWVSGLDLALSFRADSVALMMTLLVSGIGTLVFIYAAGYFGPTAGGGVRFPTSLLAFSFSMLGLVLADQVWTLFIFWEFTSITSFMLVGHKDTDPAVQAAARRALLITGGGGLVLLAGLLVLADVSGSTSLDELVPVSGSRAALAGVLIMIGAATKSAQFPFHVWLPGAMAAPTPVSAYLHSATMVKAGVLLVAVAGPAFADIGSWSILGLAFGGSSMLWGAIGALRHRDAKLILAWGTISQLGLIITLLTAGSAKATFAGISILFAHALFKAALFLVVGEIDVRTGTRVIDELGGLASKMPIATAVAVSAGLSMAGVPPLLGFAAKEAAVEAILGLDGVQGFLTGAAVIIGSTLTVAYTARFLLTVFGPGPDTKVAPRRMAMTVPASILGLAGIIGFFAIGLVNPIVGDAATELNPDASVYELIRWPGLKTAFFISAAIVGAGTVLGLLLARRSMAVPETVGADAVDGMLDGVLDGARVLTARVQHGSLPFYLATMATVAALALTPFLDAVSIDHLILWDEPLQGALVAAIAIAAFAGTAVGSRLGAALTLGAVGIGVSGLFIIHGAPDLALTQLLVETVIVVGFVLGLGRLSQKFPEVEDTWRTVRVTVAGLGGIGVMVALAAASAEPTGSAPLPELVSGAVEVGGGRNVVNVILTDLRALDTLGEVVVLAAVALGIIALTNLDGLPPIERPRSNVIGRGVEAAAPLAIVVGTYLLFAGHNNPGGGFAAGLVFGAVLALRAFAGLSRPTNPTIPIAIGVIIVAAVATAPLVVGDALLDQAVWEVKLPVLGKVKSGSALPFDIGVAAIVVGLVAALLNSMTDPDRGGERVAS